MFFVNARPCNLPQVAKAFNEVYKSYNISQSPFVFANLVLDTSKPRVLETKIWLTGIRCVRRERIAR